MFDWITDRYYRWKHGWPKPRSAGWERAVRARGLFPAFADWGGGIALDRSGQVWRSEEPDQWLNPMVETDPQLRFALPAAARDSSANLLSLHLAQALTDWTLVPASTFRRMDRDFAYRDHRDALSVIDLRELARVFRADAALVPVSAEAGGFRLVLQLPRQSTDTHTIYQSPHRPNQAALRTAADSVAKIARPWVP
jgi:hypothetical protein